MEINLDFEKESMDILKLKQQDDRTLVANIFSDGVPFDLVGALVKVNASNYLGQAVIQTENISIAGNKVTINLMRDITRVAGMTKLEIAITKTNKQLTTFTFYLDVKQSVLEGAKLEVSIVADIIEVLTTKINEAVTCKAETEKLIKEGNAATKGDVANLTAQMDSKASKDEISNKASISYVDNKFGNIGNTKSFKGSCLFAGLPTIGNTINDYWYVTDKTSNYCWNGNSWIDVGNGVKLAEGSVMPIQTSFCEIGKNRFNIDEVKFRVMYDPRNGEGVENSNESYNSTGYIPVLPNKKVTFATLNSDNSGYVAGINSFISFFNINKNKLSYKSGESLNNFSVPNDCYFIRITMYSTLDYAGLLAKKPILSYAEDFPNLESMYGNYYPFKYKINKNNLDVVLDLGTDIKLKDNIISPINTTFCKQGANRFNIYEVKFGVMYDPRSNTETANSNYWSSGHINVEPNKNVIYATLNSGKDSYIAGTNSFVSFFDGNKNLLSYKSGITLNNYTIPTNCYYVRISMYSNVPTYENLSDAKPIFAYIEDYPNTNSMWGNYKPYMYRLDTTKVYVEQDKTVNVNNLKNDWYERTGLLYGDSITAISNDETATSSWGFILRNYFSMKRVYGRGIGGQTYSWRTNGGSVAFANADGSLNSRDDNFNYDNFTGTVPSGTTKTRGAFCSWNRIINSIPTSIKDTIDFIVVMGGTNDISANTLMGNRDFINGSSIDTEWKASSYYNGGDFDISTYIGGMCSTIMKLQAWCPNAIIIVATPLNGRSKGNGSGVNETDWFKNSLSLTYNDYVIETIKILKDFGIPCIDIYGTCGINPFNRATYITDLVHPYNVAGNKALARAVIGGLKGIVSNL